MSRSDLASNLRFFLAAILTGLLVVSFCTAIAPLNRPVVADVLAVIQNDFEDGTNQGWIPRGTAVLTNTTEIAHAGTHSLKTTGRTAGFNGPSIDMLSTLSPGTVYQITVWARLLPGQPADNLKVTMQRTPTGGSTAFDQVTPSTAVTDAAWVSLQGTYSFTTAVSGLLLYVEAAGATTSYYIDDFSIVVVPALGCASPPDTSGIHTSFESGAAEGWRPRIGRETLTVTSADTHSGNFSLLTTGRQAAFDGPAINAAGKLCNGSRYNISVWAKLAPGQPNSQLRVSIQRSLAGTTNFNTVVPNTNVTANAWVQLKVTYDFAFNYDSLTLYVESNSGTASFYIDDFDLTFVPPPVAERNIPSVFQTLAPYFPIGAAINQADLTGEHAVLLTKHYNSVTSENDMKWDATEPSEGNFTFATADAQVAFARTNHILVRGHTLLWHNQIPAWVFRDASGSPMTPTPENKALLLQRLDNHIRGMLNHFGADVYAWDVANEVIDPSQPDGYRRSTWFNIIGPEYIEHAFRTAHDAAPNAKLYINDFSTTDPTKRAFLFNLISDFKQRGVPIDGIGHQMHNNIDFPSGQAVLDTINMFAGLGVDNQITELDVSVYAGSNPTAVNDYSLIPRVAFVKQAYRYKTFFDAFRQLQGKISSVTFWGEADDHTWLTSASKVDGPLLFDTSLQHKMAYSAIIDPSQLPCNLSCPTNVIQANDSGQCGATVTFTAPGTTDPVCGATTCSPAPGTFFPVGLTTVSCSTPVGSNCSFTVTINDTQPPVITCPANVTVPTAAGQCQAVVTFGVPAVSDQCPGVGAPVCSPASGSTFPKGATTVSCSVSDAAGNSAGCSFTVTVNDTEPPVVSCSPNLIRVAPVACPVATSLIVSYASPAATDNCPGVTAACVPPSGSSFPLGTSSVTCTATDTAGNSSACGFTVTVFNVGLQDDSDPSTKLLINTSTGQYQFYCGGTAYAGTGSIAMGGCTMTLVHNSGNRRVQATLETANKRGTANLLIVGSAAPPCRITDRDMTNDSF